MTTMIIEPKALAEYLNMPKQLDEIAHAKLASLMKSYDAADIIGAMCKEMVNWTDTNAHVIEPYLKQALRLGRLSKYVRKQNTDYTVSRVKSLTTVKKNAKAI